MIDPIDISEFDKQYVQKLYPAIKKAVEKINELVTKVNHLEMAFELHEKQMGNYREELNHLNSFKNNMLAVIQQHPELNPMWTRLYQDG